MNNRVKISKLCYSCLIAVLLLTNGIGIDAAKTSSRRTKVSSGRVSKPSVPKQPNHANVALSYAPSHAAAPPKPAGPPSHSANPPYPVQHPQQQQAHVPQQSANPPYPVNNNPRPSAPELPKDTGAAANKPIGWNVPNSDVQQKQTVSNVNSGYPHPQPAGSSYPHPQGNPPPYSPGNAGPPPPYSPTSNVNPAPYAPPPPYSPSAGVSQYPGNWQFAI